MENARPSLQFTGIAEAGAGFGAYCGCDFQAPQRFSTSAVDRARAVVRALGAALAGLGYRGVFGVDVLVHDGSAVVVEINARPQGSTWLLGEIERGEGRAPLLVRHVLERHGRCTDDEEAPHPAAGSQLGIRHRGPAGTVTAAPRSGVHALDGDRLVWRRPGSGLLECGDDECVIVGVPRPGRKLLTTASLGILVSRRPLARDDGRALTAVGSRLVAAFHDLFTVDFPDAVAEEVAAL